jgi:hypothetical protein
VLVQGEHKRFSVRRFDVEAPILEFHDLADDSKLLVCGDRRRRHESHHRKTAQELSQHVSLLGSNAAVVWWVALPEHPASSTNPARA